MRKRVVALAGGMSLMLLGASAASAAPSSRCSDSRNVCYGVIDRSPLTLQISIAERYFSLYRLCVRGPDAQGDCVAFPMVPTGMGTGQQSTVRWSDHFPNRGHGRYRVTYRSAPPLGTEPLGRSVFFRRTSPQPSMRVFPSSVRPGRNVLVYGSAACLTGSTITLISEAFPSTDTFAGVPAVNRPVTAGRLYRARIRIPAGRQPGMYSISARCSGGNLGLSKQLAVLPAG